MNIKRVLVLMLLALTAVTTALASNAANEPAADDKRIAVIAHIANEDDIDMDRRTVYLRTYYFGNFVVKLADDVLFDNPLPRYRIKVTLAEPAGPFPYEWDAYSNIVEAVMIEDIDTLYGQLVEQTKEYVDVRLGKFNSIETDKEILRVITNEYTAFSSEFKADDEIEVSYELDEDGNIIGLLINGIS